MQSRSSLENHTQFHTQTNLGQSLYPFSDQNGARAQPFGAAKPYMAYTRGNPPPPPGAAFIIVFERRHISYSCLPFTLANWSVHGFGKLYAEFRTGKFCPGIAFTICTNQFHLPKNDRDIKYGSEEMEHKFPLGTFRQEEQDYLFKCSVALGNFSLERPKKSCSIYFQTGFSGNLM